MKALIVLLASFIVSLAFIWLYKREYNLQLAARIAMSIMLVFTAIGHFIFPEGMKAMIPSFVPFKEFIVISSGIIEIVFAIVLLGYRDQKSIGIVVILFFLLILPANIYGAIEGVNYQTGVLDGPGPSYLWFRIPLQMFFIAWVYFSSVNPRYFVKHTGNG